MPAVSYLNFLVFNQLVLIPKYRRPGFSETCKQKDEQVRKIFSAYFPGKKIIQIDTWGINIVGGGIKLQRRVESLETAKSPCYILKSLPAITPTKKATFAAS